MKPCAFILVLIYSKHVWSFIGFSPLRRPNRATVTTMVVSERAQKIFKLLDSSASTESTGGAGGLSTFEGFQNLCKSWISLKNGNWKRPPEDIVTTNEKEMYPESILYDVIVCGGTLGIFYALALQLRGFKIAVLERGIIMGRAQEWNISTKELMALVRMGIFSEVEVDAITSIEFNPARVGFNTDTSGDQLDGFNLYVKDILNLGVKPDVLIALAKKKFESLGGIVYENEALSEINIFDNGVVVSVISGNKISGRLVLDSMGNGSPISRQIRGPCEPDGICIVVGSCARGFNATNNTYSDIIFTDSPVTEKPSSSLQYFWESFPAGSGPTDRTTYLFTYLDAKPERPTLDEIFEDYLDLLPRYQGTSVEDLKFLRVLYGVFPTYRASPLRTPFSRILAVGDASGIQSPLSFGGFGSLTRHIERVVGALTEALDGDFLSAEDLSSINTYQPNLSAGWMFQRAMSVPVGKNPDRGLIVGTLKNSFSAMEKLGDTSMRPFLQDVIQFIPLLRTLVTAAGQDLLTPVKIVPHVGFSAMFDFVAHFTAMGLYTFFNANISPLLTAVLPLVDSRAQFYIRRTIEAWKFGSGMDYFDHET